MGRKRVLTSEISVDERLVQLSDFEFRIWALGLPHTDDWGTFLGDAAEFKVRADPRSKRVLEEYENAIRKIIAVGLWTEHRGPDGRSYIRYREKGFETANRFFIKNRKNPLYPLPEEEQVDMPNNPYVPHEDRTPKNDIELAIQEHWGPREVMHMGYAIKVKFVALVEKFGRENVIHAIEVAAEQNKKSYRYVLGILESEAREAKGTPGKKGAYDFLERQQREKDGSEGTKQ